MEVNSTKDFIVEPKLSVRSTKHGTVEPTLDVNSTRDSTTEQKLDVNNTKDSTIVGFQVLCICHFEPVFVIISLHGQVVREKEKIET